MTNYGGALRRARAEIMCHIPELAPQLRHNRKVILQALEAEFIKDGHRPAEVSPADWNKAERYAIASYAIRQQVDFLVDGTGRDARFNNFLANDKGERTDRAFRKDLKRTQARGAKHVARFYSSKNESAEPWYPSAARRYRQLGKVAFFRWWYRAGEKIRVGPHVPLEGAALYFGMRTDALGDVADGYIEKIAAATTALPKEARLQAAHDLASSATSIAGVHFLEVRNQPINVGDKVIKDETNNHYQSVFDKEKRQRPIHRRYLPTTRLKCPAHTKPHLEGKGPWDDSALQDIFHASINAAFEFGYYNL